jgi:hypothetical protein
MGVEAISKKGFWFKIASGPRFHARPDSPSDFTLFVGHKAEEYGECFEDLKRGTNPAEKGGRPKDFFEIASNV